jgi:hypothetical protein
MKSVNYMSTMCFSLLSRRGRATERPRMYAYAVSAGELQASGDDVCGEVAPNKKPLSPFIRIIEAASQTCDV